MVRRLAAPLALVVALGATPATAVDVVESQMQVSFQHEGADYVLADTHVPLLPGNACHTWYVRLAQTNSDVVVGETLTLPIAIDWGPNQNPEPEIREDRKAATTTVNITSDSDGWISRGWCVAEGDPTGAHLIEVSVNGEPAASFPFEVLAPEVYDFPIGTSVPDRALRSANNTW